jgi:hypothetical protein
MSMDLSSFEGLWVAISDGHVVSSGQAPKKVYSEAMKATHNRPVMLTKIPKRGIVELL